MKSFLIGAVLLLAGCATKHAYIPPIQAVYGPPQVDCWPDGSCELVHYQAPSQLTPAGCFLHKVVTLGHTAQECKKPKRPTSRRSRAAVP